MYIYILVFLLLFLASFINIGTNVTSIRQDDVLTVKKNKKIIAVCAFATLTILMGCRSLSVGADTYQYYQKYLSYEINGANTEFLYQLVNDLFSCLGVPWQVFLLLISAFISYTVIRFVFEFSPDPAFSVLLYMTIGIFSLNMSGIRQSLAITVCLLGLINFIKRRQPLFFLISIGLAFFIHNSAIIMLAILPVYYLSRHKWFFVFCIIVVCLSFPLRELIVPFLYKFAPERYQSNYYDISSGYNLNILALGIQMAPAAFYYLCSVYSGDKNNVSDVLEHKEENVFLAISLICMLLYALSFSSASIGRMAFYFQMANCVLIPLSVQIIKDARAQFLFRMTISCLAIAVFMISTPDGSSHIDNYTFFFSM